MTSQLLRAITPFSPAQVLPQEQADSPRNLLRPLAPGYLPTPALRQRQVGLR